MKDSYDFSNARSDRAMSLTFAGGTPVRQGTAFPPVASLGEYPVMVTFKRRQLGVRPEC